MDNKFPFTSYDFWAYLSAGFLLLFGADYVFGTGLLIREEWKLVPAVIAISAAYVTGHLVASASSMLYERLLVNHLLGAPRSVLFGKPRAWNWVRYLLAGYFQPLPQEAHGVMQPGTNRSNWHAERFGDFGIGKVVLKTQVQYLPLQRRKTGNNFTGGQQSRLWIGRFC